MTLPAVLATAPSTIIAHTSFVSWLPTIVMILGILALGVLMWVMFERRARQLKMLAAQIASDLEEARALRMQLDEVHARASNMMGAAQRLSGKLDARVQALDTASVKMHATRAALPQRAAAAIAAAANAARTRVAASAPPTAHAPIPADRAAPPAAPRAASVATMEAKPQPSLDPLTRQVYQLADAGRTSVAIARDLNEQIGKVELILALRQPS